MITDRHDHQFQRSLFIVRGNSQASIVFMPLCNAAGAVYVHNAAFLFLLKYLYYNEIGNSDSLKRYD